LVRILCFRSRSGLLDRFLQQKSRLSGGRFEDLVEPSGIEPLTS
jgi:hypothetical protein